VKKINSLGWLFSILLKFVGLQGFVCYERNMRERERERERIKKE
jgi:hypothetical protein